MPEAALFFGILFVPFNRSPIVEGTFADSPGLAYRYDRDSGVVQIWQDDGSGTRHRLAEAHIDVEGSFVGAEARAGADNQPKLCPDPSLDHPGARQITYQQYVSTLINGRPLPPGLAVALRNPVTGKSCHRRAGNRRMRRNDRTGYLDQLNYGAAVYPWRGIEEKMINQAKVQLQAAQGRPIEWHFAERAVADHVRELFERNNIPVTVIYTPWRR